MMVPNQPVALARRDFSPIDDVTGREFVRRFESSCRVQNRISPRRTQITDSAQPKPKVNGTDGDVVEALVRLTAER